VTQCGHYFCCNCASERHRDGDGSCAICFKQTLGLFNAATKLNAHAKRAGGFAALFKQRVKTEADDADDVDDADDDAKASALPPPQPRGSWVSS
jgi:hypothetical protein